MQDFSLWKTGFSLSEEAAPQPHGFGRLLVAPGLEYYEQRANHKQQVLQENSTCGQAYPNKTKAEVAWTSSFQVRPASIFQQIKQLYRNVSDQRYL